MKWEDSPLTTELYQMVKGNEVQALRFFTPPPSLPYEVDSSRPSLRTNWTRLVPVPQVEALRFFLQKTPLVVHTRSGDGRGPLWWAYEFKRKEIVDMLLAAGADPAAKDTNGIVAKPKGGGKKKKGKKAAAK